MATVSALWVFLTGMAIGAAAQKEATPVLACNLKAIQSEDRARYRWLVERLRASVRLRTELKNGYTFRLDGAAISLSEAAEWMKLERRCCPFLNLQLSATGNQESWQLSVTGPEGVKRLLDAEFAAGQAFGEP